MLPADKSNPTSGQIKIQTGGAEGDISLMTHVDCPSGVYQWAWIPDTQEYRWVAAQMETQRNRSSMKYKWDTTSKTKMQMVYGIQGNFAATAVSAGMSYSTGRGGLASDPDMRTISCT